MYWQKENSQDVTRRSFLIGSAATGTGLVLALQLPLGGKKALAKDAETFAPNAFLRISTDNSVTVIAKHFEMGQGTYTGLATLAAEELDADWAQVKIDMAPANANLYNNLNWGKVQGTGGSSAMANSHEQMRKAGATARLMLLEAAADNWKVSPEEISIDKGVVSHKLSGKSATFGELALKAAEFTPPIEVSLKNPKNFKLIGTHVPRIDTPAKTDGSALFTLDVTRPGMLTAVLVRPPRFGGTVISFDDNETRNVRGVEEVVQVPDGIAVLAKNFWAAKKGAEALKIEWNDDKAEKRGSKELMAHYRKLAETPGLKARDDGDADKVIAGAAKVLEADFEFPYLAHAPMEPLDCVVELGPNSCEIWAGCQVQTIDQHAAAKTSGLKPDQVKINTLLAGGSFGRRAQPGGDLVIEAVSIAKAIGGKAPVKLVWTREDDIKGGRYRPMYFHRLKAGLDDKGRLIGWQHRIVGQSIMSGTPFEGPNVKNGIDHTSVEGASNLPYDIPNLDVDLHTTDVGVPILWWRSVGSSHTAYSTETFIDELAHAAGKDPVTFRLDMLANHPRHAGVLKLVARKAGWGQPLPKGISRGVAVHESFNSYVAQVAEVSVSNGVLKVERVVCAVDCGLAINPDVIKAQMEGGIGYGLGAILRNAITLNDGLVEQSNFHDYEPLRIDDMPKIEVHIVRSAVKPTGVGEPGVPPIGPAVANAVFAATGKRIRLLPFSRNSLSAG
jgi:isoquinoline 1-oxidoreductase subunit beta